jgi:hypothetical protein
MPALPDVPAVIRLSVRQVLSEDIDVINRIFVKYSGSAPNQSQLTTFAAAVGTAFVSRLFANLSHELTGFSVTATDLTSATSPEVIVPMTGTGASVTASCPAGTALVISAKIARRYRGGHPRTYICGLPNDQLTDAQSWTSTLVTAIQTDFSNWISDIEAAGWTGAGTITPVNVSYYQGFVNHTFPSGRVRPIPVLRPGGPVVDLITAHQANTRVASQRRRNLQV